MPGRRAAVSGGELGYLSQVAISILWLGYLSQPDCKLYTVYEGRAIGYLSQVASSILYMRGS